MGIVLWKFLKIVVVEGRVKKRKAADSEKHGQKYLEGWIEFKKKRIAKQVAESLNNAQVGGKRRSPYYESLWNIKYLNRSVETLSSTHVFCCSID